MNVYDDHPVPAKLKVLALCISLSAMVNACLVAVQLIERHHILPVFCLMTIFFVINSYFVKQL